MRINRLFIVLCLAVALLPSCKKGHYDVNNVHGVDVEGELLLPIATQSFTMMDMMERFHIDSLITCSEAGELSYLYYFEDEDAVDGKKLLTFKDLNHTEHYAFENPHILEPPSITDTMLRFQKTIVFEAEHISAFEAEMKSGSLEFQLESNVGNLRRVVLRSPNIKDGQGHDFVLDALVQANTFGFDLTDLHYLSDTANALTFEFELYCYYFPTTDPELYADIKIVGRDLAMRSMRGYVEAYGSRNAVDTVFSLFPNNLEGVLEVEGVSIRLSERNTFPMDSRLVVDTALVTGENVAPYSILEPLPLVVDLPSQHAYSEVFSQSLHGMINACGGRAYASSDFIVNPAGVNEVFTVFDTCNVDVRVDVEIPFDFKVDDVTYVDTVNMNLTEFNLPEIIECLTLELTFNSTLPLNLSGHFYMYDSENDEVTDVLLPDSKLIQASFDGQPATTTVSIDVTEERIDNVLRSDCIIMAYALDTDARDVKLNANQKLSLFVKAKVKYDGVIEQ